MALASCRLLGCGADRAGAGKEKTIDLPRSATVGDLQSDADVCSGGAFSREREAWRRYILVEPGLIVGSRCTMDDSIDTIDDSIDTMDRKFCRLDRDVATMSGNARTIDAGLNTLSDSVSTRVNSVYMFVDCV